MVLLLLKKEVELCKLQQDIREQVCFQCQMAILVSREDCVQITCEEQGHEGAATHNAHGGILHLLKLF